MAGSRQKLRKESAAMSKDADQSLDLFIKTLNQNVLAEKEAPTAKQLPPKKKPPTE